MKKLLTLVLLCAITSTAILVNAQSAPKLGHINSQELLASMPESDSAQAQLEKVAMEHESIIEEMSVEFNKKFEAYRLASEQGTLSDLARASKEAELQDLQTRIQTFEQNAQQTIQKKQVQLLQPIQQKALDAINAVAEENGFTYIFDLGSGALVYTAPESQDILPMVKAKLGLK